MGLASDAIGTLAPIFLVVSPLLSYTDQILSIRRKQSSAGFSLDIPLIMLSASLLKIFYWPGAQYDKSLLIQAFVMVAVQLVLLKAALDNRSHQADPNILHASLERQRPYGFWQWSHQRPYWEFLAALFLILFTFHTYFRPASSSPLYFALIGYIGLTIEATLPLPQLMMNRSARSCKGFRVSVLANWLIGDAMKMSFFFLSGEDKVPWAFRLCGMFQAACDLGLGLQYWAYGEGRDSVDHVGAFRKEGAILR